MQKRVLYFVPEFPRLTETFIEREISKLIEFNNLDIHVLSLAKATGATSDNVKARVDYKRINLGICVLASFYFLTRFNEIISAYKLVRRDPKRSKFQNLYLFLKSIAYTKIMESYKPDQIHVHFLSDPSTIAMVASKILHIPFSISAHAKDVFVEGTLIAEKVREARFISICNGYAWQKCIELSKLAPNDPALKKVHKIYHGMDPKKLFAGEIKLKKPERPMIFVGGRLVEKKGLKYAIEASRILKDRGVSHEMHIVGPGPLYGELVAQVEQLGLQNVVFLPGDGKGLPNAEVMEYFKIADIFAHPSIETGEGDVDGVPTFVIEAALAHMPIVTTKAGAITDLLTEENGILVPQRNSAELASALEKLIFDPELRKTLGQKAYDKASVMFNIENNVGALEKLFLE